MTVKEQIVEFVRSNGRSRISEIANGIDYSTGYVRRNTKKLIDDGKLEGEKVPSSIPTAEINGDMVVIAGSRSDLLDIVEKYAPSRLNEAKNMQVSEIRNLIEEIADDTSAISDEAWEVWV